MRTWRSIGKICLKYAVLNVVIASLMIATAILQSIPPAEAESPHSIMESANTELTLPTTTDQNSDNSMTKKQTEFNMSNILSSYEINPAETPNRRFNISAQVSSDTDHDIQLQAGARNINLHIPEGAIDRDVQVDVIDYGYFGSSGSGIISLYEMNAYEIGDNGIADRNRVHSNFNKGLTLTIQHEHEDLAGLDLDTLRFCYLDQDSGQWTPVPDSSFNRETLTLTATIEHFSYYGEMADPVITGPGKVLNFQTNLHSGASTYSYPIEVPAGTGGLQPNLNLIYNSASVDEMKNKRDVGSWVGIGWSLSMGYVFNDSINSQYIISLDGNTHYKLMPDSQGMYHTIPETFWNISRDGQQWDVYDTEGTYYRFGGTDDSEQFYDDDTYYRWDLNYIQDTSGNNVSVTYVQDIMHVQSSGLTSIRSAYPQHIQYNDNHIDILFNSSFDVAGGYYDGNYRADTPQPLPKVCETRKLDSIDIELDGNLVRRYSFTYNTTDDYYSSEDYTYHAGKHTLTSITEIGSDGTSQLPAITFSYTDFTIHCDDIQETDYFGNPGNPAELAWPYLTYVDNGYGATISYSYSENPSAQALDIWTREVVTEMTSDPGNGEEQTYQYTYIGVPQYFDTNMDDHPWEDEYRGFAGVRVTDADGNYVDHFYWTTGDVYSDVLTGKEYRTEWYDSYGQLLDTKEYDWTYGSVSV